MELRHLRYFMAVAEELHFRKASERLRIAQPALSIQIRDLEEMLGGLLFERNNRSVKLTAAGQIFYTEAKETLKQAERAVKITQYVLRGELGCVKNSYSGSAVFSGILGEAVHFFRERHPDVDFELTECDPLNQIKDIAGRDFHAGFLTTLSLDIPDGLDRLSLASWSLGLAIPDGHRLADKKHVTVNDIKEEPFVIYAGPEKWGGASMIQFACGFEPKVSYQAANVMLMLTLMGAGVGVAMFPYGLKDKFDNANVAFRRIEGMGDVRIDCSILWNSRENEPAARAFIEAARVYADR